MSSSIPPNPWYNGIIFNPDFFTANTETLTIEYANKTYLKRIGANPTSIATKTTFTGNLELSNPTTARIDASTGPLNLSALSTITFTSGANVMTLDTGGILTVRNSIRSANGGSGGFLIQNRGANTGDLILNNLQTASDMFYRQAGTIGSHIFQTNDTGTTNLTLSNTANTFGTLGIANQGNLSFSSTNPIISSSSTTNNLRLQSGVGQGIGFLTNGGTSVPLTLESSGQATFNSTIRGLGSGSTGLTVSNRLGNIGGLVLINQDTGSDFYIRQAGTTKSMFFQNNTSATNMLTLTNTANTSNLPLTVQGNLTLSSASPTISSTSTTSDFVIQTASSGSQMIFKSQGATSFELNGVNITTPTTSLINAGQQIIFRTLGTDANISATTTGTNINIDTSSTGQVKIGTVNGNVTTFGKQTISTPGPVISLASGTLTLALPLHNMYFITTGGGITVSLPTNSSAYAGTRVLFRRISPSGNSIAFNQTGGASVMVTTGFTITGISVTFPGNNESTEFVSDGTNWYQLYSG
jgi:hypothetical protein